MAATFKCDDSREFDLKARPCRRVWGLTTVYLPGNRFHPGCGSSGASPLTR
jgi:hypothetical protein